MRLGPTLHLVFPLPRLQVSVVDTPDWFNSERTPDELRAQISACVTLSSPGPHVFLFCVPLDQPAKTELQALAALQSVFGPAAVQKHTMVLFTHVDRLKESERGDGVEAYIAGQRGDLLKLVEKCRDRFHVLEWRSDGQDQNVSQLLEKVEQTVQEAGGQYYSCPAFQEAEDRVRQRQMELARERKRTHKAEEEGGADVRQPVSQRRGLHPYLQPLAEAEEEEVKDDEIERTRDEAEMSVKAVNIESLPPVSLAHLSPSLFQSIMEKIRRLYELLSNSAGSVSSGAAKVRNSPVWGTVGSRAQSIQKVVAQSPVWDRVGSSAGQVSKLVGDRVPKVVVESSAWVGSGAKAAAASPVWGKVGSGAKLVAGSSVRVGAGIGAGAKKVAQSPLWGKMGSGAKAGAKRVAESSVWEKAGKTAKRVPAVVMVGALLGLVLGICVAGVIGGAAGAAAGSAVTEVGRRKLSRRSTWGQRDGAADGVTEAGNESLNSVVKKGEKVFKSE